ncbi:hypothetical protein ABNG03_08345 [Halorubrum sp. RMP-47]|uniref:Uncharacterized protein n=1 Tax=Halorubrum miltondacostae TaxID=3076378 RepID=A0ABD5M5N4_9EURY
MERADEVDLVLLAQVVRDLAQVVRDLAQPGRSLLVVVRLADDGYPALRTPGCRSALRLR